MGNDAPKQEAKPIDPNEAIFQMKMSSKKFTREANKAKKEKDKALLQAKKCLKVGDEDGARLFVQQANQKEMDSKKFFRMSHQFEYVYNQIKSQNLTQEMTKNLTGLTVYLKSSTESINCDKIYNDLNNFNKYFDNFNVQGKILNDHLNQNMNTANPNTNDDILNQLKNDVNYEMAQKMNTNFVPQNTDQNTEKNNNYDLEAELKNL